ncbi:MAG: Lsr2 family protein [Microbacteriaceae bacterium]|nr:Lsr2 family protein [Microbacteriaceae bacterium]MCL2796124.1 Lsr2 family protein [Microbacteriaceae bacterium]
MKKVIEQLVDDLDGELIADGAGETVAFALDGKSYEIDLNNENAAAFREVLQKYISAGRRASSAVASPLRQTVRASRGAASSSGSHWSAGYAVVREWAQANGVEVSPRGRVADSVMKAYEDAHK